MESRVKLEEGEEGEEVMMEEDEDSSDQSINEQLYSTKPIVHSETLKIACTQLLEMYIDEEYFNLGREIGQRLRWGDLDALGILNNVPDEYRIVDLPGVDIFGNPTSKKYNFECECPKCHRTLAASRFAPHLEKCMGMGRNSSRIASRRLAAASSNNSNANSSSQNSSSTDNNKNSSQGNSSSGQNPNPLNGELGSEDDHFEEDDDDEDWSLDRKKKSKKATEKVTVKSRKGPLSRVRNTEGSKRRGASPSVTDSPASLGGADNIQDEDDSTHMSLP